MLEALNIFVNFSIINLLKTSCYPYQGKWYSNKLHLLKVAVLEFKNSSLILKFSVSDFKMLFKWKIVNF